MEFLNDGNDCVLTRVYETVLGDSEVVSMLNDGNDDLLNKSYEKFERKEPVLCGSVVVARSRIPDNLLPFVQCTEREIERKRMIALMKLREKRGCHSNSKYFQNYFSEFFWPIDQWPIYVLKTILFSNLNYRDRITLATFFHGNNLRDPDNCTLFFQYYNKNWNT